MITEGAADEEDKEMEAEEVQQSKANPDGRPVNMPEKAKANQPAPAGFFSSNLRLQALAIAAAERVARKETQVLIAALKNGIDTVPEAMDKHAVFVMQALGVAPQQALAYIDARRNDPIKSGEEESTIYEAALARLTKLAIEGKV